MSRRTVTIITAAIIISSLAVSAVLSNMKKPVSRRQLPKKDTSVRTITVENSDIRTDITITGRLSALDKVEVYAEVSGTLLPTGKRFKPGNSFTAGEPLIRIDESVYRNNMLAQKSSLLNRLTMLLPDLSIDFPGNAGVWKSYLENFDLTKPLAPLPETENGKERYYIASRDIYSQFYTIKSMEATLDKYTIRAPFNGVVTSSQINPGTLVRQGQKLGEFSSTAIFEMEAFAGISEVLLLSPGMPVTLTSSDMPGSYSGKISRINEVIDPKTQLVAIYINTDDPRLRDGLYMTAHIESSSIESAVRIPRGVLTDGNRIPVIEDSILIFKEVTLAAVEDGQVIVQGLPDGTEVVVEMPADAVEGTVLSISGGSGSQAGPGDDRKTDEGKNRPNGEGGKQ